MTRFFRRISSARKMPEKFEALATYNSERHRGLVHTPEFQMRMARLQAEFDVWVESWPEGTVRIDG